MHKKITDMNKSKMKLKEFHDQISNQYISLLTNNAINLTASHLGIDTLVLFRDVVYEKLKDKLGNNITLDKNCVTSSLSNFVSSRPEFVAHCSEIRRYEKDKNLDNKIMPAELKRCTDVYFNRYHANGELNKIIDLINSTIVGLFAQRRNDDFIDITANSLTPEGYRNTHHLARIKLALKTLFDDGHESFKTTDLRKHLSTLLVATPPATTQSPPTGFVEALFNAAFSGGAMRIPPV